MEDRAPKRPKDFWNDDEKATFCSGLKRFGKSFEQISAMVRTKSKDQTQAYYYRLLKKTLKIIPGLGQKKEAQVPVNSVDTEKDVIAAIMVECLKELKVNGNKRKRGSDDLNNKTSSHSTSTTSTSQIDTTHTNPSSPPSAYPTPASSPLNNLEYFPQNTAILSNTNPSFISNPFELTTITIPLHIPLPQTQAIPNPIPDHHMPSFTTNVNVDNPNTLNTFTNTNTNANANANVNNTNAHTHPHKHTNTTTTTTTTTTKKPTKSKSKKLPLQLTAKSQFFSMCLSQAGHNPKLQLNIKPTKNITYIINYLNSKWTREGRSVASSPIRLYPVSNDQQEHPGWGIEDSFTTVASLCETFSSPSLLRLNYAWNVQVHNTTETPPQYFAVTSPSASIPVIDHTPRILPIISRDMEQQQQHHHQEQQQQQQQIDIAHPPIEPEYNIDHFIEQVDNSESGLLLQSPAKVTQQQQQQPQQQTPTKDIITTNNTNSNPTSKISPSTSFAFPLFEQEVVLEASMLTPLVEGFDSPFSPSKLLLSPHPQPFSPFSFSHSPSFTSPVRNSRPRINRTRSRGLSNEGIFPEISLSQGLPPISLSSLFEEASFDGFARNNNNNNINPESECKDFYKNFETNSNFQPSHFQTNFSSPPKKLEPPIFSLLLAESDPSHNSGIK